ncbi:hypothetical protein [Saguinine gammaherpesvirus 1]|uniref:CD80-like immunoglobulin C2-set domain-containing protein n=1 Tax=Saguinine gammaherpesvirus 1 TaxID=2169901 RepID=A0A9Q8QWA2_9GAMA|nr:hypothetical protein [Saguinine gammaherpesvirus 1]
MHTSHAPGGMSLYTSHLLVPLLTFLNLSLVVGTHLTCETSGSFLLNTQGSIKCILSSQEDPPIIILQKKTDDVPINVATISRSYGADIQPAFTQKINATLVNFREVIFTILNISISDQGCYICLFHLFSTGIIRQTSCITVKTELIYGSQSRLTEDKFEVSCYATSYPPAAIYWGSLSPDMIETYTTTNENGTVTVTSVVSVSPLPDHDQTVSCQIEYNGSNLTLSENFEHRAMKTSTVLSLNLSLILAFTIGCFILVTVIGIIFFVIREFLRKYGLTFLTPPNIPFIQLI